MNSQYRHGGGPEAAGLRGGQYPGSSYDEEEDFEAPPSYDATLESVPLGTEAENRRLLDQVDQLRACGVDQYIDLPQIVVVGDQSTGKSSVLEALTKIPFPRSSVKCTKFATQIRLRRADQVQTIIGIIPHKDCSSADKQRLAKFKQTFDDDADFDTIFNQATDAIFPPGVDHQRFLSSNILSIEKSGPSQPHLTVVDLPGFIHSPTMEQTADDKADITALARQYMKKERTIILPVVSGAVDISNQVVLGSVKEMDPKGLRTLGIITKPDMAETEAKQMEFINLASNKDKKNKLQLGWHVLRNRKHDEMDYTPEERNKAEADFFADPKCNWGRLLKPNQLGVEALSKRLSTQLIRHIAAEVFKVRDEIEQQLDQCREKLGQLGEGKDTPEEMRTELYRWCERSLRMTQAAVQGHGINPSGEDFFPYSNNGPTYARNFRSRVVIENKSFATLMENWGAACLIIDDDGSQQDRRMSKNDGGRFPEMRKSEYINKVVVPLLDDNPGTELSMDTNPLLAYRLFQSYSRNWVDLATQHINTIHKLCDEFLVQVLQVVWPPQIQTRIWSGFIKSELESMLNMALLEMERLKADRLKLVTPYESEFLARFYERKEADAEGGRTVELRDQKYDEVLRKMLLLYQSNLKTFMTNVIVQVIERHIADGLEEVFHDRRVRNLTDEQVRLLVEDDYQVRTERQELRAQEATLSQGKEICRQISMRSDLGPYEYPKFQARETQQGNGAYKSRPKTPSHRYNYPSADISTTSDDAPVNLSPSNPVFTSSPSPGRSSKQQPPTPPIPSRPAHQAPRHPDTRPPIPNMPDVFQEKDYGGWSNGAGGQADEAESLNSFGRDGHGQFDDSSEHGRKSSRTKKIWGMGKRGVLS